MNEEQIRTATRELQEAVLLYRRKITETFGGLTFTLEALQDAGNRFGALGLVYPFSQDAWDIHVVSGLERGAHDWEYTNPDFVPTYGWVRFSIMTGRLVKIPASMRRGPDGLCEPIWI